MNEIKELHVMKRNKRIEVSVKSDTATALALLSVLILAMEKEMGISTEKILDTVRKAIEIGKKEPAEKSKKRVSELEDLGTLIVKWFQENSCPYGAVIVDSYGIRIYSDADAPVVYIPIPPAVPKEERKG